MKFETFKEILESMKARVEWEEQMYKLGVDVFNIPNDPYEWVMKLMDEIYPESKGDVSYFCWEKDFGANFKMGDVIDEFGRECDFSSIEALWEYLENREWNSFYRDEPYTEKSKLLASGVYLGIAWYVNWSGVAPCAYIDVTDTKLTAEMVDKVCHGGVTWNEDHLPFEKVSSGVSHILGWDYAHCSDWDKFTNSGYKWTTAEIVAEVKQIINQLKGVYAND